MPARPPPRREAVLGPTALTNDHPLGVQPVDDGQLVLGLFQNPAVSGDPAVKLPASRIECTSCHHPHRHPPPPPPPLTARPPLRPPVSGLTGRSAPTPAGTATACTAPERRRRRGCCASRGG